jgi:hypothetical protein
MPKLTIGADPELFIADTLTGQVQPIFGLLGGTKDAPVRMEGLQDGFAMQEDNVMAEFNIPPVTNPGDFLSHISRGIAHVRQTVRKNTKNRMDIVSGSEYLFSHMQLGHDQALYFGCAQDYSAYEYPSTQAPRNSIEPDMLLHEEGAWRLAGGHIHLGYKSFGINVPDWAVAKLCDLYIGLPSIAVDKQNIRRALYGSPGLYRPTKYGIEDRTLSNFWLFDKDYTYSVASAASSLLRLISTLSDVKKVRHIVASAPWEDVRRAIYREDERTASAIIADVNRTYSTDIGTPTSILED